MIHKPTEIDVTQAHILVVEDNPVNLEMLLQILAREGYENVTPVSDPREVEPLLDRQRIDLVALDLRMPHINGLAILAMLRARFSMAELPVIVITAQDDMETRRRALEGGANDFISKPFDLNEATRRVANLVWQRLLHETLEGLLAERSGQLGEANAALARSHAWLETVLDSINDGLFSLDGEMRLLSINPVARRLLGVRQGEAEPVGRRLDALWPGAPLPEGAEAAEELAPGEIREYEIPRPDGHVTPVSVSYAQVTFEGQTAWVGTLYDLTERHLAEAANEHLRAEMMQAQKMEALGSFAGGVAHDFNNMLSIIRGYAGMIAGTADLPEEVFAQARHILQAAEQAGNLTSSLLAFGRKKKIEPRLFDLGELVAQQETLLRPSLGEDIEFTISVPDRGLPVMCDPGQIQQVLVNMVVNARDAVADPGAGRDDEPGRIAIEVREREGWAVMEIADNGCGMEAETAKRLFEPFYTTKEVGKGSGLGLSIAFGVIRQAGGHTAVNSASGRGTRMTITLPLSSEALEVEAATGEGTRAVGTARPLRILVAEDEAGLRGFVVEALTAMGHEVIAAADGDEALDCHDAAAGAFDLLLTDVVMPGMSGIKLAQLLSAEQPGLAVLFMTGYAGRLQDASETLPAGATMVNKPLDAERLAQAIARLLPAEGRKGGWPGGRAVAEGSWR